MNFFDVLLSNGEINIEVFMNKKLAPSFLKYALLLILAPVAVWIVADSVGSETGLKIIDPSHTCMGSNMAQAKPQNYAYIENKRYYGCTSMCIANLKEVPGFRYGLDPVSGKRVDKATALIARQSHGGLLYFEGENTYDEYKKRASKDS